MKLTVYIVDDEPMALRYLEMLLKGTTQELEVIGTAPNGVKAITEIARLRPDFVFADISMPVMDGLKMSEEVLKQNPAQKIFILTAYRDFEYAKKSVGIGVADYILKNELSERILDDLISKHVPDLDKERRRQHTVMETNLRNYFLSDTSQIVREEFYQDKPMQRYVLFYIAPRPEIVLKHQEPGPGKCADCFRIENSIAEEGIVCRAFIQMFTNEYCGIFFIQENVADVEWKCKKVAEHIMINLAENLAGYLCLISSPVSQFSKLQSIYSRLRSTMGYLYDSKKEICLEREILPKKVPEKKMNHDLRLANWKQFLERGDSEEAAACLDTYLSEIREFLGVWEYTERIKEICRHIKTLQKREKLSPGILNIEAVYTDVELLEQDIKESQNRYLTELRRRRESHYSKHIILAQEYIHNHYSDNISISDIAGAAGISEGHLRRCFKKELNVSVLNYLTDYRLNCAKILLKDSTENIDSIWEKAGFMSAQYFSYVFKKKEGITPRDYRKSAGREDEKQQDE